jgi:hypothetical protein
MVNDSGMNIEMEYLLTADAYFDWMGNYANQQKIDNACDNAIKQLYFKEHGLPLDSEIKG